MAPEPFLVDGSWVSGDGRAVIEVLDPATEEAIGSVPGGYQVRPRACPRRRTTGVAWMARYRRLGTQRYLAQGGWSATPACRCHRCPLDGRDGQAARPGPAEVLAAADQFDWYADEARRIYGRTVDGHQRVQPDARPAPSRGPGRRVHDVELPRPAPVAQDRACARRRVPGYRQARRGGTDDDAGLGALFVPMPRLPRACSTSLPGTPPTSARPLLASPVVRQISLTGSVPVGRPASRTSQPTGYCPVSMELGRSCPGARLRRR